MNKLGTDEEYKDWLADRFFVFYLNRTRTYQARVKGEEAKALLLNDGRQLQKINSVDSRYIAVVTSHSDLNNKSSFENHASLLQAGTVSPESL